ncbi:MAG: ribonuclease R [Bacteroidales bacterium]|nr:ribonuclease R [Bacteroidales bacterium]
MKNNSRQSRRQRHNPRKNCPEFIGKVQMTREGSAFVLIEGQDDVFVRTAATRNALNGDTVKVSVTREGTRQGRREGRITEIVERSSRPFVGILHLVDSRAWVLMQSRSMPYDIEVDLQQALDTGARHGMKVAVVVDHWNRNESAPAGHVVEALGEPGANDTEMHAILAEFNLPHRFSKAVENAADRISDKITREDLKDRRDFRDTLTFTIDPSDAKDFDDALSYKVLPDGRMEVGVHIADVSWYVRPGTPVDKEARERGTSVYLVDRTVPMLPEKLSNKLCSLRPHEAKLTFSVVFCLSSDARVISRWIGRTVIESDFRLDYDQAQAIITGDAPKQTPKPLKEAISALHSLASKLKEQRFRNGAIDFDRPEMKIEVDAQGRPVNVFQKYSQESNWLIEEFMLLANRTVAEFVATGGRMNGTPDRKAKAFVYRVHGEPDLEKLENLRGFAGHFGYKMGVSKTGKSASEQLRALLNSSKGKPENKAFENLALRSMAKACYSTENIGHYGLAFSFYTHFTSPIRRYPDTMVHRLLSEYLAGGRSHNSEKLEKECRYASERESVAADAERTSIKYKLVEFMQDKIGREYEGSVSGLTEWGMYVEIDPTGIEGMIPLREIRSDFFEFDESRYCLKGKRTRRRINFGDRVRIRVKNANLEQRLLDFELIEDNTDRADV